MPRYVDSSVLLSLALGDANAHRAYALWTADTERVSSLLLDVECTTVLRRVPEERLGRTASGLAFERLDTALEEVTLKPLDAEVARIVRDTPALAACRSLDAAHLATALYFHAAAEGELELLTFDVRLARAAVAVGLTVCGVSSGA